MRAALCVVVEQAMGGNSRFQSIELITLCAAGVGPGSGPGASCHTRATRGVSNGQLRSPMTTVHSRSRPGPGHHLRVPKLTLNPHIQLD